MDEKEKLKAALDQIHAEESLKTSAKKYLFEKVYFKEKKRHSPLRKFAAAAVCSLAVFIGGGSWLYFTPTAFISVDVNPSLELGINRFDRIVSVEGYNEDGDDLAESLDITFMNYSDALDEILSSGSIEDYLSGDALMSLTVAGDNATQYTEILDTVETCADSHENIHCHSGDTEEMHEAHDAGVSFGKYRAYLILHDLDPSISLDNIRSMTMREIYDLIDSYNGNQGTENTGTNTQETETNSSDTNCDPGSRSDGEHGHGGQHHGGYVEGETD